jgi:glycosyltransferase involved in cell wall biosynthesis
MSLMVNNIDPEVSVLMSCFNGSRWLHQAIDSVLAQSFTSFELILINDGSIDDTWEIIESYRNIDSRVVAINKNNTGLADSLNFGISIAKGKWIARLDQDDLCESTRLEEQVGFMLKNLNVVLLGSGFIEFEENNKVIKKHTYPSYHKQLVRNLERSKKFFPHSSAFYKVEVVKQLGGYNKRIHRAEDRCLWLELATKGNIACLPKPLVKIRKHADQMSLDENGRRQFCDSTSVEVCYFLRKKGFEDPSNDIDYNKWVLFHKWIEERILTLGIIEKRNVWIAARKNFFNFENKLIGLLYFFKVLMTSSYFFILLWEKYFGSFLSKKLAREWIANNTKKNIFDRNIRQF